MTENHNAKYAFYYLLSLAALVFMSISVGLIAFSIINKSVADALTYNSYDNYDGQLKFAISALFIAAPIFYAISGLINRGLKKGELEKDSAIRRWLTYFIILVSSVIILGVFVGVINNFLSGEMTARFIFKAISVFVIAAAVFSYYFYDIKRADVVEKDLAVKIFFFASLAVVVAAFVAAWFFVESPKEARNRRLDQIVVNNIYSLESAVNSYYERHKALPENFDAVKADPDMYFDERSLTDPETGAAIEYKRTGQDTFEFCATFRTNSFEQDGARRPTSVAIGSKDHEAGYQCLKSRLWSKDKGLVDDKVVPAQPVPTIVE